MLEEFYTMVLLLLAVVLVIFLAYFTTLLIGKKSNSFLHSGNIRVLERFGIGYQVSITVVKIGGKVYILAVQGKQVTLLDSMEEQVWQQTASDRSAEGMPFQRFQEKLSLPLRQWIRRSADEHEKGQNTKGQDR